jgi:hypothetical protein
MKNRRYRHARQPKTKSVIIFVLKLLLAVVSWCEITAKTVSGKPLCDPDSKLKRCDQKIKK